ncbi:hypothetical protein MRX96_046974 [Rhipicephalus microplus]
MDRVLHRGLQTHYVAGCSATVSAARTENKTSLACRALTLQDVTAVLEELKRMLRDANHEQLTIQTQMNYLIEQSRNQASRAAIIVQDATPPAASSMAKSAAPSRFVLLQESLGKIQERFPHSGHA